MSTEKPERSIPDVNVDGFVALEDFLARAKKMKPEEYARRYNVPGLLVEGAPEPTKDYASSKNELLEASYKSTTDEDRPLPDPVMVQLRYAGRVAFLTKRPGNIFPEMFSIGRALNCDILLALSSCSKIHGLIHREAGGKWSYSDQASKNGTLLNGKKLNAGDRYPIGDGDKLQVGLHFTCTFLEPDSLLKKLRGRR